MPLRLPTAWRQPRRRCLDAWRQPPRQSEAGRFVIPSDAMTAFKTHCDLTFGGQVWFDVLNQMGGCPAEFVEAYNTVFDHQHQVASQQI